MTALEKAARAAADEARWLRRVTVTDPATGSPIPGLTWENLDEVSRAIARAVLLAVREPGGDVLAAGEGWSYGQSLANAEQGFTAMIDAILSEGAA